MHVNTLPSFPLQLRPSFNIPTEVLDTEPTPGTQTHFTLYPLPCYRTRLGCCTFDRFWALGASGAPLNRNLFVHGKEWLGTGPVFGECCFALCSTSSLYSNTLLLALFPSHTQRIETKSRPLCEQIVSKAWARGHLASSVVAGDTCDSVRQLRIVS